MKRMLWLFDIDGVLVNIPDVHIEAYRNNYRQTLGITLSDKTIIGQFGATELATHVEILKEINLPPKKDIIDRLIANQTEHFIELLKNAELKPLEGVVEFLSYLQEQGQYLGVVTGNLMKPARFILKKSGLDVPLP